MNQNPARSASPPLASRFEVGGRDFVGGLQSWRIWTRLGWNDVRQRYRRSVLGPFWITLSVTAFITLLGVIYARLFGVDIEEYLPYLAIGYIVWGFISSTTIESCNAFHENAGILRQRRVPFSIFIYKTVWRNLIVLGHTIVLVFGIYVVFGINPGIEAFMALLGVLLLCLNQVWVGTVLAILNTRFGDVIQIVTTFVQIMLFATPILWPVDRIGNVRIIADVNPVFHFIQLIRAPLLGQQPEALSWLVAAGTIVVGTSTAVWLIGRTSRRIVYWI